MVLGGLGALLWLPLKSPGVVTTLQAGGAICSSPAQTEQQGAIRGVSELGCLQKRQRYPVAEAR